MNERVHLFLFKCVTEVEPKKENYTEVQIMPLNFLPTEGASCEGMKSLACTAQRETWQYTEVSLSGETQY